MGVCIYYMTVDGPNFHHVGGSQWVLAFITRLSAGPTSTTWVG